MLNFPIPYSEELVYSTVARLGIREGIISPKELLDEIYGNRKVIATLDLPNQLQRVSRWLPSDYTVETIAYRHTLFPLYAPFIPEERRKRCLIWMAGESRGAVHLAMGVTASLVKVPVYVRYCPGCLREQVLTFGEYFWQREWQIAGVECCERHGELLSTAITRPLNDRHHYHEASPDTCPLFPQKPVCNQSAMVLTQARHLLGQKPATSPSYEQWSAHYHWLAQQHGCIRRQAHINHVAIAEAVSAKWSAKFLQRYGLGIDHKSDDLWLRAIFRKHRKSFNYLQHIIVHHALLPESWCITEMIDHVRELSIPSLSGRTGRTSFEPKFDLTKDQQDWMKMLEKWPPKTARAANPPLYARLYRYDRLWLIKVNQAQPRADVVKRKLRVDWQRRDLHYLFKLREILRFFRVNPRGPRHSQTYLLKLLGKSSTLEKKLNRLPRTRRLLKRYSESVCQYQMRRLRNAWQELRQDFEHPPRWRLIRIAGLSETRLTHEARDYLNGLEENDDNATHQGNRG
ncbi:TnsD family Tn7-like transposition protein [Halomonas sp. CSM-2]|uniref:TnsD family Tn7-like transposition protein n=1 Tax=Halomonas sp. CSM-2 TaxID=1975722 RepID=UPI000A28C3F7|nr:TnsD family Tn7-like transposition protein [Halomonas sp. CSM-2]